MSVLRPATDADVPAIRRWRNHPDARRVGFTPHEISAEDHARWWQRLRADPRRAVVIYERGGVPAGVVVFAELDREVAEWGFFLDRDGLGDALLGAWLELERAAIAYAFGTLRVRRLGSATLAENRAVLLLHRRCGFVETRRYVREVDGRPRDVIWTELAAPQPH